MKPVRSRSIRGQGQRCDRARENGEGASPSTSQSSWGRQGMLQLNAPKSYWDRVVSWGKEFYNHSNHCGSWDFGFRHTPGIIPLMNPPTLGCLLILFVLRPMFPDQSPTLLWRYSSDLRHRSQYYSVRKLKLSLTGGVSRDSPKIILLHGENDQFGLCLFRRNPHYDRPTD